MFILVIAKSSLMNIEELTEDNDFGLALAERPSSINQGNILFSYNMVFIFYNII